MQSLQVGLANPKSLFSTGPLLLLFALLSGTHQGFDLHFKLRDHVFLCLLGLSMFSLHYLFVYHATSYIVSGTIAVVFSGVSFLSIVNNYVFLSCKTSLNITLGALIGVQVVYVSFLAQVTNVTLQGVTVKGLGLAATGTLIFRWAVV